MATMNEKKDPNQNKEHGDKKKKKGDKDKKGTTRDENRTCFVCSKKGPDLVRYRYQADICH